MKRIWSSLGRTARIAVLCAFALVLFAGIGFLAVPPLARALLQDRLSEAFDRPVRIAAIAFNPFTLRAAVDDVSVGERAPASGVLLQFRRLEADVSWRSITSLAPVVSGVRLLEPRVRLSRDKDGRYSIQDLIDKWTATPSPPDQPPPRFAVANIEIVGGGVEFDDQPIPKLHRVTDLEIRVPFVSSLPVHQDVHVHPRVAMKIDGTAFELTGAARPFSDTRASTLQLDLAPVQLVPYLRYLPRALPVKVESLTLSARAQIEFEQPVGAPAAITIRADATLADIDVRAPDGAALFKAASVGLQKIMLQPLRSTYAVGSVALAEPVVTVHRRTGDDGFFAALKLPADTSPAAPRAAALPSGKEAATDKAAQSDKAAQPGQPGAANAIDWRVDEVRIADGVVDLRDEQFVPRTLALRLDKLSARAGPVDGSLKNAIPFELAFSADGGERIEAGGRATPQPLLVEAKASAQGIALSRWWWVAEPHVQFDALDGVLGAQAELKLAQAPAGPAFSIGALAAELRALKLRQRWDKRDLLKLDTVQLSDGSVDLSARAIRRDAEGTLNLGRLAAPSADSASHARPEPGQPPTSGTGPVPGQPPTSGAGSEAWTVSLGRVSLDGLSAKLEDASRGRDADLLVSGLSLTAEDLSTERGRRGRIALKAKVGPSGALQVSGPLALNPVAARLQVDARRIGILPMQPYFTEYVNAVVSSGMLDAVGNLAVDLPERGVPMVGWQGRVALAEFAAVTKSGSDDLLRWKSLNVSDIDFALQPLKVEIGAVALTDFYARLIVRADGTFNLQDVLAKRDAASAPSSSAAPSAAASPPAALSSPDRAPASATSPAPSPASSPAASSPPPLPVRIGRIALTNGNIDFSDFFVRPNYSANLTGMTGAIGTMTPDTPGDIELRGRVDNAGSVEVLGSINPLAASLFLDLKASARDIDLPRTSPYSVKYLGYGIEKGKLSANLKYLVKDRQLQAENNIVLDQLTFGEKVDSPTATKLPVLFAIALLKDRNGVIDVDMPIGGSLDDPQFSVGGLVLRIILNLIVKAVTAPFSLLASIGGGGAELSWIGFAPGRASIDADAQKRLESLAKALSDRPGLKLEIAGRVDGDADREALRRTAFERRLKALKLRESVRGGTAGASVDAITLEPAEVPALVLQAYRAARFDKPRNAVGLPKELPVAEMERMLVEDTQVGEGELVDLALHRAEAAKEWLVSRGGIAGERLFIVAGKSASGEAAQAPVPVPAAAQGGDADREGRASRSPRRVDLSLK